MTTASSAPTAPTPLHAWDDTARRLLGLTLDDLTLVSDRTLVGAAALVAREAGPPIALDLLDVVQEGARPVEGPLVADERVRLLLEAERYGEAAAAARERLARAESLIVRGYLARALLNSGESRAAAEVAAAMLAAAPDKITSLYVAGLVALSIHRPDEARAHFELLSELHADSPAGPRGLARLALLAGDPTAAFDLARRALECYTAVLPPPDLVRELEAYASRITDGARAEEARRYVEEAAAARAGSQARRDESLRARLAEEAARIRAGGVDARPTPRSHARARDARQAEEEEDDGPEEAVTALPPAPPPDPARHDGLVALLRETYGYERFRAGQEEVISAVVAGRDTLAVMPTGAGKSLCYQLSTLLNEGVTLVISPLIALMKDQVESLPPALLARTTLVNSGLETAELTLRLGEIATGRYRLVYASPERLRQRPFVHALTRAGVRLVVIDEAHCLSMWGHDFRPDYLFISAVVRDLGDPQVLAMTATATPAMMGEIATGLGRDLCVVNTGVLRDNLFLIAHTVENDDHKLRVALPFIQRQSGSGIVYVNSRDNAERLERALRQARVNARAYHAGLGTAERGALQDRFMAGEIRVMVATVAFGMGIDKADVRFIVHYHPSRSLEAYSQESGRAGRDGQPGTCLLLHSPGDRATMRRWSREQAVDIGGLRAVYRSVRAVLERAPGGTGLVDAPALRERLETEGKGDVDLRVAISILELAGLLRRGPDVPRGATVSPRGATDRGAGAAGGAGARDDLWEPFLRAARLDGEPSGWSTPLDLVVVASALGIDAVALEDWLLTWQDDGRLVYRGVGRDMLIELLPPPADTAERMAAILDGMGRRNRRRLRALFGYLDADRCRHGVIARHFGHEAAARCGHCDICAPVALGEVEPVAAERVDDPAEAVRRLVGQFPLGYGKTGVVEVLKGAMTRRMHAERTPLFGALAHLPKAAIERTVAALLAEGELVTELRDDYAMLRLRE